MLTRHWTFDPADAPMPTELVPTQEIPGPVLACLDDPGMNLLLEDRAKGILWLHQRPTEAPR